MRCAVACQCAVDDSWRRGLCHDCFILPSLGETIDVCLCLSSKNLIDLSKVFAISFCKNLKLFVMNLIIGAG